MKIIKILFFQGLIDLWNFRDLTKTVFNFGIKNKKTDVWFAKFMIKNFLRIFFNLILNLFLLYFFFHEAYGVYNSSF